MDKPTFFLRPLQHSDAPLLLTGRNAAHVRSLMLSDQLVTPETHRAWMDKRIAGSRQRPYFIFLHGDRPLGLIGLSHFEEEHGYGEWGFYLWTDAPRGAGTHM